MPFQTKHFVWKGMPFYKIECPIVLWKGNFIMASLDLVLWAIPYVPKTVGHHQRQRWHLVIPGPFHLCQAYMSKFVIDINLRSVHCHCQVSTVHFIFIFLYQKQILVSKMEMKKVKDRVHAHGPKCASIHPFIQTEQILKFNWSGDTGGSGKSGGYG